MRKWIVYLILLSPFSVFADWFEGEASMLIGDAPVDQIRQQTIKNAIADASFQAGAMVSSEDILLNGLLVNSKVMYQSQGMVRRAQVLQESIDDGILSVRVKVDISPTESCKASAYARSIMITQFQMLKPKQAAIGGVFELNKHVTKRIEQQLAGYNQQVDILLMDQSFTEQNILNGLKRDDIAEKAEYLRRKFGHQFAVFGTIRDLSAFKRITKNRFSEETTTRRNFTLRIYVLDIYHKAIVWEESYHSEADWDFALHHEIDMNSSIFWGSDYGRAILNTISSAVVDINDLITCQPIYAQVVRRIADRLVINLGRRHGVKMGDKFFLLKALQDPNNLSNSHVVISPVANSSVQVVALDNDSAQLASVQINGSVSAQLLDLVSPIQTQKIGISQGISTYDTSSIPSLQPAPTPANNSH